MIEHAAGSHADQRDKHRSVELVYNAFRQAAVFGQGGFSRSCQQVLRPVTVHVPVAARPKAST